MSLILRVQSELDVRAWQLIKQAGGGPAATHFSCFAKKSEQKKATAAPLKSPLSVRQKRDAKNSLRSDSFCVYSAFAFCHRQRRKRINKVALLNIDTLGV
jgi:hypothetical protein